MKRGYATYKEIDTMGMSQVDLILTVYRGAMAYLDQAQSDFESGKLTDGRTACERARKCIVHLYTTLDMEKGGAIADQLARLYAYIVEQLDLAVANKSCRLLHDINKILGGIKEGWEGLKRQEIVAEGKPAGDKPGGNSAGPGPAAKPPGTAPVGNHITCSV
jgi:flagellar secretion chaperone FliS